MGASAVNAAVPEVTSSYYMQIRIKADGDQLSGYQVRRGGAVNLKSVKNERKVKRTPGGLKDVPAAGRFNSGPAHHAGDGSPAGSTPAAGTTRAKA